MAVALSLGAALPAQRDERPPRKVDETWADDPYTEDDPVALRAAAGYVKYAPLAWTAVADTTRIEQALGDVKLRWVETAHFRIGSELGSWKIPGDQKDVRKRLTQELARLAEKLPAVPTKPKSLDPWLRVHLYAQRLEDLYAELSELLGVTDASFPQKEGELLGGKWMGRGRYLGVGEKFNVLLCSKESTCVRYLTTFTGADGRSPSRWYWAPPIDGFLFATATEFSDDAYADDTALYCHVVFNMVANLLDAYCGFVYEPPIWWQEGLGHSFRRKLSDKFNNFTGVSDRSERIFAIEDWAPRVYGLVKHDIATPLATLGQKTDFDGVAFNDHLALWSRVEFLRSLGDAKLGRFITRMKQCVAAQGAPPPADYVLREQDAALQEIWGYDSLTALDDAWKKWALKEYRGAK